MLVTNTSDDIDLGNLHTKILSSWGTIPFSARTKVEMSDRLGLTETNRKYSEYSFRSKHHGKQSER